MTSQRPRFRAFPFLVVSLSVAAHAAETSWAVKPVLPGAQQLFPQGAVRLLEGPFKTMQDVDHAYLMRLEPDRLLAQFRVEAGLEPKAKPYGGWESPAQPGKTWSLAGHSLGHYLSALSLMYRLTDDYRLKERVAYLTQGLKECQDKRGDGSLVAFPYARELEADIRSNRVETIDKYWAPFYTIHKELAGLRDAWVWCGDDTAKTVMGLLADWCGALVKDLPDERRERLLNMEHGGMAEVLADVYAITGDRKYLDYARLYSHHALLDPLADGHDTLTGKHANTQVPKFIGFQRIHELSGDARAGVAATFFWQTVVKDRTWVNGGNSIHEHFPEPKDMGKLIPDDGGPETCNTYNMLKLTEALYREKPAAAYVDYYENALFNHILASQAPLVGAGAFVYYTPLRPDFGRAYGGEFNSFWCCTGTGMENHARYGAFVYSHDGKALTVNLFMATEVNWRERGVALRQETRFPDEAGSTLVFTAAPADALTLRLRHPLWLAAKRLSVSVNGHAVKVASQPGGYAELTRKWQAGDRVRMELPMKIRVVRQAQTPGWVSFFYGPVLLAGELGSEGTTQADYIGRYTPVKALRPLAKAPVVIASRDEEMVSRVTPVPGRPGAFQTVGLVKPADVTLAPFFRTHFQRYALYWQVSDLEHWEANRRSMAEAERLARELDARTVDRVRIGEQQSEIDHNLRFEQSQSGTGPQGKRWRDARGGGWFSYEIKLPAAGTKAAVYILYWGQDDGQEFDLQVEGTVIAAPKRTGGTDDYCGVEYPVAAALLAGKDKVTVRVQARPRESAGSVYDLRVITVRNDSAPNPAAE
ncbi:MAG: beta-L-arabinofuranosidase domain-containing protein [bacterium]